MSYFQVLYNHFMIQVPKWEAMAVRLHPDISEVPQGERNRSWRGQTFGCRLEWFFSEAGIGGGYVRIEIIRG